MRTHLKVGDRIQWRIRPEGVAAALEGRVTVVYPEGKGCCRGTQHAFCMVETDTRYISIETGRTVPVCYAVSLSNPSIRIIEES